MAQSVPFDCPDHCLFYEQRAISGLGWTAAGSGEDDTNEGEERR